jgi:uncharacterized protein YecE (DUF72 family)
LETRSLPAKVRVEGLLEDYATRLTAVEINYTFRQLPKAATLENWLNATPAGFVFACKAHLRITHINRLKESEFTEIFFKALEPLRASRHVGPALFQPPPNTPDARMQAHTGLHNYFATSLQSPSSSPHPTNCPVNAETKAGLVARSEQVHLKPERIEFE